MLGFGLPWAPQVISKPVSPALKVIFQINSRNKSDAYNKK